MIDLHTAVIDFLQEPGYEIAGMVEDRFFGGRHVPPEGYEVDDGPCVVFRVRGGGPDYDDALLIPSVQFKVYGHNEERAFEVYRALYDRLHLGHDGTILHAESEVLGQPLEEVETEWRYVLAFFLVMVRQT